MVLTMLLVILFWLAVVSLLCDLFSPRHFDHPFTSLMSSSVVGPRTPSPGTVILVRNFVLPCILVLRSPVCLASSVCPIALLLPLGSPVYVCVCVCMCVCVWDHAW